MDMTIPARPGLKAVFRIKKPNSGLKARKAWLDARRQIELADDEDLGGHATVEAWDENGRPLIIRDGVLVSAKSFSNFVDVIEHGAPRVQLVPADGWSVWRVDSSTGVLWSAPLVAWALHSDGAIEPLESDGNGDVDIAGNGDGTHLIRHSSEGPPPTEWVEQRKAEIAAARSKHVVTHASA